jgi:predicted MFS family arabinose efflux permease
MIPTVRANRALDALNCFLADVRGGLGPYLAVYLLTVRQWDEAQIGLVMSAAGIAGILAQTPSGALVDAFKSTRVVVIVAALVVTTGSLLLPVLATFWPVLSSQAAVHASGALFGPAIAAISLGVVGHARLAGRVGRNEAFNHAGNACAALAAAAGALIWGPSVVFMLLAVMAVASLLSAVMIPTNAIDHARARGLDDGAKHQHQQPSRLGILLTCRPLLILAVCAVLFHFANAAMLPLVGQKLALQDRRLGTSLMSVCIVAAQVVMVPMAMLVGHKADVWGRKPLFLAAFLVLPIRGFLYTLSDDPYWLVGVQLLDGVGAGLYGALFPIVVADLMQGTGRFNLAQGAVVTAQEIGASLSMGLAGFVVVSSGYSVAFLILAAIAAVGLALFWFAMPETYKSHPSIPSDLFMERKTERLWPLAKKAS